MSLTLYGYAACALQSVCQWRKCLSRVCYGQALPQVWKHDLTSLYCVPAVLLERFLCSVQEPKSDDSHWLCFPTKGSGRVFVLWFFCFSEKPNWCLLLLPLCLYFDAVPDNVVWEEKKHYQGPLFILPSEDYINLDDELNFSDDSKNAGPPLCSNSGERYRETNTNGHWFHLFQHITFR